MSESLKQNPFRLLGISIENTIIEIEKNYSRMKIRASIPNSDYTTLDDPINNIFPIKRTKNNLTEAYNQIKNMPTERLKARLLWFNSEELDILKRFNLDNQKVVHRISVEFLEEKHLKALISYYLAINALQVNTELLKTDTMNAKIKLSSSELNILKETLAYWKDLIEDKNYWDYLYNIELESEVVPKANKEELDDLKDNVINIILEPFVFQIQEILCTGEYFLINKIIEEIKNSSIDNAHYISFFNNIISLIESKIKINLDNIYNDFIFNLENIEKEAYVNEVQNYTNEVLVAINKELKELLDLLETINSLCESVHIDIYDSIVQFFIDISKKVREETDSYPLAISLLMEAKNLNKDTYNDFNIEDQIDITQAMHLINRCYNMTLDINDKVNNEVNLTKFREKINSYYSILKKEILNEFTALESKFSKESSDYETICQCIFAFIRAISLAYHNKLGDSKRALEVLILAQPLCVNNEMQDAFDRDIDILNRSVEELKTISNEWSKEEPTNKKVFIWLVIFIFFAIIAGALNEESTPNKSINSDTQPTQQTTQIIQDELIDQIDRAKEQLVSMENKLNIMLNNIEEYESELNYYEGEIRYLENNYYDASYEIDQYNYYVNLYNDALDEYQYLYDEYESLSNSTNKKIDEYNNR